MNLRIVCLAMGTIVAGVTHAEAKVIDMGVISRSEVKSACDRAGGHPVDIENLDANYGCNGKLANIACTVDHVCHAIVGDTRPMTGNSLDYVLTYGQAAPPATMIQPQNRRIVPQSGPIQ